LWQGIPTTGEASQAQGPNMTGTATAGTTLSGLPNSVPLNMFPQVKFALACELLSFSHKEKGTRPTN